MLIDLQNGGDPRQTEVLIIGAGAVGLTMAVKLARAGRDVTLLEAGGRSPEPESQALFEAARWGERRLEGLHLGRFRALGGTTNFWGGQLVRFDPIVFEQRSWVADIPWPITREELDPFYDEAYQMLGVLRPLADEAVWQRLDILPPPLGDELDSFFTAWAPDANFARIFQSDINARGKLRVFINAPVVALGLDEAGQRVSHVVARTATGTEHRFPAQRVIL